MKDSFETSIDDLYIFDILPVFVRCVTALVVFHSDAFLNRNPILKYRSIRGRYYTLKEYNILPLNSSRDLSEFHQVASVYI